MSVPVPTIGNVLPAGNLVRLVDELAANIRPHGEIWRDHGVTDRATATKILSAPVVQEMIAEARAEWNSRNNVKERIRQKSLFAIEGGLGELFGSALDTKNSLSARTDVFRYLAKLGGLDEPKGALGLASDGNGGVLIHIDLSGNDRDEDIMVLEGAAVDDAEYADDADEEGQDRDEKGQDRDEEGQDGGVEEEFLVAFDDDEVVA